MSGRGSSPHPGRASILRAPSARCPRWNRTALGAERLLLFHHEVQDLPRPGLGIPASLHLGLATRLDLAQAFHGIAEALDLRVDVRVSHGILELLPEDRGSRLKPGH